MKSMATAWRAWSFAPARVAMTTDSDYDVVVFLRDMPDRFAEPNRLADLLQSLSALLFWMKPASSFMLCLTVRKSITTRGCL